MEKKTKKMLRNINKITNELVSETNKNTDITTIKISKKTKQRLEKLRVYKRESYEEILSKILDILNICRANPERAQRRLITLERQMKRESIE